MRVSGGSPLLAVRTWTVKGTAETDGTVKSFTSKSTITTELLEDAGRPGTGW